MTVILTIVIYSAAECPISVKFCVGSKTACDIKLQILKIQHVKLLYRKEQSSNFDEILYTTADLELDDSR